MVFLFFFGFFDSHHRCHTKPQTGRNHDRVLNYPTIKKDKFLSEIKYLNFKTCLS